MSYTFQRSSVKLIVYAFLCLIFVLLAKAVAGQQSSGFKRFTWTVKGVSREALVYIPTEAKTKASPVIFAFHGHGGNMNMMLGSRSFEKLWPEAIVVYPQGLNTPGQLTNRDLDFFDAMLKTLQQDYQVDPKRIYATGHSNGGGFTYLLWATRGDLFAAFGPSSAVAGQIANLLKPKPALHIMGEQDPLVKPTWQRAMCEKILQIDNCSRQGQEYGPYATFYSSTTKTPVVLYVHPGGHVYPEAADVVLIKFFKSMVNVLPQKH